MYFIYLNIQIAGAPIAIPLRIEFTKDFTTCFREPFVVQSFHQQRYILAKVVDSSQTSFVITKQPVKTNIVMESAKISFDQKLGAITVQLYNEAGHRILNSNFTYMYFRNLQFCIEVG